MKKIAIITPRKNRDYLTDTVLDGLLCEKHCGSEIDFKYIHGYPHVYGGEMEECGLPIEAFSEYAREADAVFIGYRYGDFNPSYVAELGLWDRYIFLDGSEPKHNNRYDPKVQRDILKGDRNGPGFIHSDYLKRCVLYLRREKPYKDGIVPFPFGIESKYIKYSGGKKDIDFACMFGQDEYPLMRRYAVELLEDFCEKNGFKYFAGTGSKGNLVDNEEYLRILARSKVGVSIGGGGFDTLRFWEILANNCILLTERIDIYQPDGKELPYDRIYQFNNLHDFVYQLERIGSRLGESYDSELMWPEYEAILASHSSRARVGAALTEFSKRQ